MSEHANHIVVRWICGARLPVQVCDLGTEFDCCSAVLLDVFWHADTLLDSIGCHFLEFTERTVAGTARMCPEPVEDVTGGLLVVAMESSVVWTECCIHVEFRECVRCIERMCLSCVFLVSEDCPSVMRQKCLMRLESALVALKECRVCREPCQSCC